MKKIVKKLYIQKKRRFLKRIRGNNQKPRLSISRSNNHIYAQLIDDTIGSTLLFSSSLKLKKEKPKELAFKTGQNFGFSFKEKGFKKYVFDTGTKRYKGRIREFDKGFLSKILK